MDSVEASGKSIDDAILQALARLGRRRDEVEVAVLQEPSRGHRGVGARDARVRVWLKRTNRQPAPRGAASGTGAVLTPDMAQQWLGIIEDEPETATPPPPPYIPQQRPQPQQPPRRASIYHPPPVTQPPPVVEEVEEEEFVEEEDVIATYGEEAESEIDGATPAEGIAPDPVVRQANEILREILRQMGIVAPVEVATRDPLILNVRLRGDSDTQALLIGRRGETLASLQLVVNLILNHKAKDHYHVVVDVEHYRQRRDENLRSLALRVAHQVQQSRRSMSLEPMTPYERRIVHLALQDSPSVQTQSTGEGEQRRVVISLRPQSAR
jgi:spoIIIJ-associated protein